MKKTLLLFLSLLLFLTGCGAADIHGDYLQAAMSNGIASLDVTRASDTNSLEMLNNLMEGLLCLDADDAVIPGMAESYEVSADGTTYIFHLRDAKWSNGEPVTAYDFEYAWKRLASAGCSNSSVISDVLCIKNSKAVVYGDGNGSFADPSALGIYADDEKTFRIELEVPVSFLPSVTAFPLLTPMNRSFYESVGADFYGMAPEYFLSNGPFMLEDYLPGTTNIVMKKNEQYYDAEKVQLPGISFHVVSSEVSNMETFRIGELDIIGITGENVINAHKDAFLSRYIHELSTSQMTYLSFAFSGEAEALKNKNLRLAISRSIDRETICTNAFKDGTAPDHAPVPAGYAYSLTTGADFSADQSEYAAYCGYDPAKAAEAYALAKQELGQDTFAFDVILGAPDANAMIALQIIQKQLEKNLDGFRINLTPMQLPELYAALVKKDFVMGVSGWSADYADPLAYLSLWTSDAPFNYGSWANDEYDQLLADCTTGQYTNDYDARWDALKRAEGLLAEDAGIIPLYRNTKNLLISDRVEGVEYHSVSAASYKNAVKHP